MKRPDYKDTPVEERATPEFIRGWFAHPEARAKRAALGIAGQWRGCRKATSLFDYSKPLRDEYGPMWMPCGGHMRGGGEGNLCYKHGGVNWRDVRNQRRRKWMARIKERVS